MNSISNEAASVFNLVRNTTVSVFNGIKSTATSVWNGIKNAIVTPIETAKNKVKGVVDAIKSFFAGMKISLPYIKLPHFKVTGKLSISSPSVLKLSIQWYKEGGTDESKQGSECGYVDLPGIGTNSGRKHHSDHHRWNGDIPIPGGTP